MPRSRVLLLICLGLSVAFAASACTVNVAPAPNPTEQWLTAVALVELSTAQAHGTSPPSPPAETATPPPTPTQPPPTDTPTPTSPPPPTDTPTPSPTPSPIPPTPTPRPPTPTPGPERIRFAPGATSGTWNAVLVEGEPRRYVLRALAGQTMKVATDAPPGTVSLQVLSPHGVVLPWIWHEATREWEFDLPETGDYTLIFLGQGPVQITVTIPPPEGMPLTRTRITFAPGTASYELTTTLRAGEPQGFVLRIMAGQRLYVSALGAPEYPTVQVLDPSDRPLPTERGGRPGEWITDIVQTGDHTVVVTGEGEAQITFYVPPR
ncbi:MAG: hypothetical protein Kow0047_08240 [Anaerolineae bacterium]